MSPDVTYPETAPLLRTVSHPDDAEYPQQDPPSFFERVAAVVQEPLSPLTQILLVATIIFLLLSSVFIGLFAGAQHKLNAGKGGGTTTIVVTATSTAVSTATTTAISTTTVAVPAPGPTSPPAEVSSRISLCWTYCHLCHFNQPVCLSPSCINLASSVLSSLDESQDPCENFYDFASEYSPCMRRLVLTSRHLLRWWVAQGAPHPIGQRKLWQFRSPRPTEQAHPPANPLRGCLYSVH